MDPDLLRIAQTVAIAGMTVVTGGVFLIVMRLAWRWTHGSPPKTALPSGIDEARFARLEQAVDAISLEVERIAEGQRYAVKLMSGEGAERLPLKRSTDR